MNKIILNSIYNKNSKFYNGVKIMIKIGKIPIFQLIIEHYLKTLIQDLNGVKILEILNGKDPVKLQ